MSDFASLALSFIHSLYIETHSKKNFKPFRFNYHLLFNIEISRITHWYLLFLEVLPRLNFWTQQWKSQNGEVDLQTAFKSSDIG